MAKKQKANPTSTSTKKPEVLGLKRKPPTPEQGVETTNDALITPAELPEPSVVLESPLTPGAEVKVSDAQPLTEPITSTPGAEVKEDAPKVEPEVPLTPAAKPNRPVLKKKIDRSGDAETSSLTPTTPELLESPPEGAIFQAVGVIVGEVTFDDEGKAKLAFGGKEYPLFYAPPHKKAYEALKIELKKTGVSRQRLLVYPRITHFPKREQSHNVSFQLVGFFREGVEQAPNGITSDLNDMEFKLAGLWQFIPVCQTPCVSVFKNFTEERKEFVKAAEVDVKVKFMKGSHVPVLWRDAPVRPFRFNPKLDKEQQGSAAFVQVKAVFVPDKDVFLVQALTSTPAANPPRFLKAGKKDRLQVASEKLKAAKGDAKGGSRSRSVSKRSDDRKKPERPER